MASPRPREVGGACRIQVLAIARTQETVGGPNEAARSEFRRDRLPVGVKSPSMHYILAQLQRPQNRHYSALGPLYLKIKVSKTRYSNKLTSLLRTGISVNSFMEGNGELLLFADNGRRYQVLKNGDVWSTGDKRVNTLDDCKRLSSEKIWKNDGNINKISQSLSRGRGMHR